MPSILIVDDETIFRKGLRSMITSIDSGWVIAGEARNGYEALDLLEKVRPDAMLTDIRMPSLDGVQLQKIARERFPDLVCAVISGYDDFTYVQQSIRSGVRDYLLKPIERQQLCEVLDSLKGEIALHAGKKLSGGAFRDEIEVRQHISEHLVAGLLRGTVNDSDLELLRRIGIDFAYPYYVCLVIKLDKSSVDSDRYQRADPSLFQLYIQQFVQEMLQLKLRAFCFTLSDTEVVALINMPEETPEARKQLLSLAEKIRREIKSLSKITITIGVGGTANGVSSLPKTYHEAEIALLYRLIYGGNRVIDYASIIRDRREHTAFKRWSWEQLERSISEGTPEDTSRQTELIINEMCMSTPNPEFVQQQLCKMIIQYYEMAEQLNMSRQWLGDKDIRTVLLDICSISSREELIDTCGKLLVRLNRCMAAGKGKSDPDPVDKALRYLAEHYHRPITLKDAAERVYLNPAYLSTLFRQRTGKTFVEQLTDIRIREAKKQLALTEDKVVVVAEATGFANLRHFNRVFKKETGMSPTEYREQVRRTKLR